MLSSAQSNPKALIDEALRLINQGFGPHQMRMTQGDTTPHKVVYINPLIQDLNLAVQQFNKDPSQPNFDKILGSLKECQKAEIASFQYEAIFEINSQLIAITERLKEEQRQKRTLKK